MKTKILHFFANEIISDKTVSNKKVAFRTMNYKNELVPLITNTIQYDMMCKKKLVVTSQMDSVNVTYILLYILYEENLEVTTQPQGHQQQVGRRALQQVGQQVGRRAHQQAEIQVIVPWFLLNNFLFWYFLTHFHIIDIQYRNLGNTSPVDQEYGKCFSCPKVTPPQILCHYHH